MDAPWAGFAATMAMCYDHTHHDGDGQYQQEHHHTRDACSCYHDSRVTALSWALLTLSGNAISETGWILKTVNFDTTPIIDDE